MSELEKARKEMMDYFDYLLKSGKLKGGERVVDRWLDAELPMCRPHTLREIRDGDDVEKIRIQTGNLHRVWE